MVYLFAIYLFQQQQNIRPYFSFFCLPFCLFVSICKSACLCICKYVLCLLKYLPVSRQSLYWSYKFWLCNIIFIFINYHPSSFIWTFHPFIGREFKILRWHGFTQSIRYIFKPFKVAINDFVISCFVKSNLLFLPDLGYPEGSPLVSTLNLVIHPTSINNDSKGVREVGLTCRWHVSNIIPDRIFNDWQRQGDNLI